jgi:hypothetical protein
MGVGSATIELEADGSTARSEQRPAVDTLQFLRRKNMGKGQSQAEFNAQVKGNGDAALAIAIANQNKQIADSFSKAITTSMDNWLDEQKERLQHAVNGKRSALLLADTYYDQVMSATVPPSIWEAAFSAAFMGLTLINPEFSALSAIVEIGLPGKKKARMEMLKKFDACKDLVKDVVEKGTEAYEKDEDAQSHDTTLNAKSQIIQDEIENCSEAEDFITTIYFAFKKKIDQLAADSTTSGSQYSALQQAWYVLWGGPARHYKKGTDTQFALVILYEMLREYCTGVKLYAGLGGAKLSTTTAEARHELQGVNGPSDADGWITNLEFDGFDRAKREAMYKLFDKLDPRTWKRKPKIANWVDLVKNWDFAS